MVILKQTVSRIDEGSLSILSKESAALCLAIHDPFGVGAQRSVRFDLRKDSTRQGELSYR